jgi:hypothetical protein
MKQELIELLETVVSPNELLCDGEVLVSTSRVADHLIANGVTIQKWIPVSERLPEKDGKYQVYIDGHINKGIHHAYFAKDARKVDKFDFRCRWKNVWYGYDNEWGHYEVDAVTHWMPIPEPPKGD